MGGAVSGLTSLDELAWRYASSCDDAAIANLYANLLNTHLILNHLPPLTPEQRMGIGAGVGQDKLAYCLWIARFVESAR